MKGLVEFINTINEAECRREVPKAKLIRFKPDGDAFSEKCLKEFEKEFGNKYKIEQKWSGTICFYKKGSKPTLKNLICSVSDNSYIDFGPNDKLADTLGKEIFAVIDKLSGEEITEAMIEEASAEFTAKVKNLPYTEKEPTSDKDKYVAINGYGKTWKDGCGPFYVKIEDLGKYTDQAGLMSVAYNFIKDRDSKMTAAEVCAWDKDEDKYMSFCYATLQKKNRSWHPEWVDWNINESLVNEDRLGDEFADKAKFAEEDFKKWCKAAAKGYLFTEIGSLVLIYQKLDQPIKKDGYQIDIEHVATYNTKTHVMYTDDMSLFGHAK